jgi:hypothetical protein
MPLARIQRFIVIAVNPKAEYRFGAVAMKLLSVKKNNVFNKVA